MPALENEVGNLPGWQFFADLNSAKVSIFWGADSC
jgi:hypothetical protein